MEPSKLGCCVKELKGIRESMEALSLQDLIANQERITELRKRMDELLYREEMIWMQRSRVTWLKEGDHNTKFFHKKAAGRSKKNKIKCLKKEDGQITRDKGEMEAMATQFFQDLYSANPSVKPEEVLSMFNLVISDDMNKDLCKPFLEEEISDALFQIGPLKASGPDGFPG
jgi:hypothetical protein